LIFGSGIPLVSSFCHLVIISSKYILKCKGKTGQPWHTPLLISASFDSLKLNFTNIFFCLYMSTIAFSNVSGIFLDFKISVITESEKKLQGTKQSENYMVIYTEVKDTPQASQK
jgi:hypothetical protein